MDNSWNIQITSNQHDFSTRANEADGEARKEYQESDNIQEVEESLPREQETKEDNENESKYISISNIEKRILDRNDKCENSNSVHCEKVFPGRYCEFVNETVNISKSDTQLLKRCSVVLNRCDEKAPKGVSLPEDEPQINRPEGENVVHKYDRIREEKSFRKNLVASIVTMEPENEYKCTNMDVDDSEFPNEGCSQVSNCKATSCNHSKQTSIKSVKSAQNQYNSIEKCEEQLKNDGVLYNAKYSEEEINKFDLKCMSFKTKKGQESFVTLPQKERKNKSKAFTSAKTFVIPKNPHEPASRHKVVARRSCRNLKKQINHEENEGDTDITEIRPIDPLLPDSSPTNFLKNVKKTGKLGSTKNNTIVVKNTEQLLQIASGKGIKRKKEPTLVIIDTNSILSGKGPVPISQISLTGPLSQSSVLTGYSVLPSPSGSWNTLTSGIPTNAVLQSLNNFTFSPFNKSNVSCSQISSLTASAVYIIDTPSFIVPHLYEQLPKQSLKKYIEQLQRGIGISKCTSKSVCSKANYSQNIINNNNEENTNPKENKKQKCVKFDDYTDSDAKKQHLKMRPESIINCEMNASNIVNEKKASKHGNSVDKKSSNCSSDASMREITKGDKKADKNDQDYFNSPLGTFFIQIGINLVKEYVNNDLGNLLKKDHTQFVRKNQHIQFPLDNLEYSLEDNQPFHFKQKKCGYCNFKTESCLVMAHHLEVPHMFNKVYKCNFCNLVIENRSKIVYHMIMAHDMRVHLECAPAQHQCPNCPFEDNSKAKMNCHMVSCSRKHKSDRNQEPPSNWEPPAKVRHLVDNPLSKRGKHTSSYQTAPKGVRQLLPKLPSNSMTNASIFAGQHTAASSRDHIGVVQKYKSSSKQIPLPTMWQRPNISITPLPNLQPLTSAAIASKQGLQGSSASLLNRVQKLHICEICDTHFIEFGDLQFHLRDIHRVKFSKKAIYSTPSLGCQKCPLRFFTDQGLERHLLGTHGLVTASFQDAARSETDGGHCPICAKLFQWKLLEHMYREHKMSLKPVNISYKCTLCSTVTFEKYKQFEDHVFAVHSLAKTKKNSATTPAPFSGDILKSLKENNEITIISHNRQSHPKSNRKTSSISFPRKKSENTNCQHSKSKNNIRVFEEKELLPKEQSIDVLTTEVINIDSSYEEDKCINKDVIIKESFGNQKISEYKPEHNSQSDTCTESHKPEKLPLDNYCSKDGKNNDSSKNKLTTASSPVDLPQHTNDESSGENEKVERFFKSKSQMQHSNENEDDNALSTSEETTYKHEHDGSSSINKYEMLNNFSGIALKENDVEKNYQDIKSFKKASALESEIDDTVSGHKNTGAEHLPQQKMEDQSMDCNKLQEQNVEIINLGDSSVKENSQREENSENSASENNQNGKCAKNSENYIFEEAESTDDTSNRTIKYKNLECESVSLHTGLVNTDSLQDLIPSIPKINDENNTKNSKIMEQEIHGTEVIQLDDSLSEDKKELKEETCDVLSKNEIN